MGEQFVSVFVLLVLIWYGLWLFCAITQMFFNSICSVSIHFWHSPNHGSICAVFLSLFWWYNFVQFFGSSTLSHSSIFFFDTALSTFQFNSYQFCVIIANMFLVQPCNFFWYNYLAQLYLIFDSTLNKFSHNCKNVLITSLSILLPDYCKFFGTALSSVWLNSYLIQICSIISNMFLAQILNTLFA